MNKRLLLIEDDESIRFALHRYFERTGYTVQCATELEEAEALAVCDAYDLVIVDLSLSNEGSNEGLEIVRFVRRHCPSARLIVLTASPAPAIEHEAIRRGAHAFLLKPKPLAEIARTALHLMEGAA
ncbi:MAG TPA: response regulator [Thermoanaerobaculia bacterium]|nr:response regulator [Thermoanaerobaculia bacterium]